MDFSSCAATGGTPAPVDVPAPYGVYDEQGNLCELEEHEEGRNFGIRLPPPQANIKQNDKYHFLNARKKAFRRDSDMLGHLRINCQTSMKALTKVHTSNELFQRATSAKMVSSAWL